MSSYTPMMQQYLQIKSEYKDAFLFFRLGDFYELFFTDATKAAKELEITLTSRDAGAKDRIPMCGVPYHSVGSYIDRLINRGYKVAICEQVEDPKQAKGVVKREVVQLITPGTQMDGHTLNEKENNYIASIHPFDDGSLGFAYCDLSTGELKVTHFTDMKEEVLGELLLLGVREVVVPSGAEEEWNTLLIEKNNITLSHYSEQKGILPKTTITENLKQDKLIETVNGLLNYLYQTQKRSLDHLQKASFYNVQQYVKMDAYSKRNLELTETIRTKDKKGSLLWLLDETMTAMGGRLLKSWIDRPLINEQAIHHRLQRVELLKDHFFERQELRSKLQEVYDVERLAGRIAFGNVNGRDLIQLKNTLQQVPLIQDIMKDVAKASGWEEKLDPCEDVTDLLTKAIIESPPISVKEGGMIKEGFHEKLDHYRKASRNGKSWIAELEQKERKNTGIKSLKVGYNRVFGYYIEVTRANLHHLTEGQYERKQTLTNAERFITPELKEKEALILEAEENSVALEYELFTQVRDELKQYIPRLQALAKAISEIDVLQSFATISEDRHYTMPNFSANRTLTIENGRHPVVEKVLGMQTYVPNDCEMNAGDREILLITGPNMAGKSTYMRQVALTAIMAQIGCFVPADTATLPVFDQIFTRIGAADDLVSGQSTFMVEMLEAKNALTKATQNSLILFDEIGRGTSTYDGMSLAQAMIEYVHDVIGAKTLFSTHYHELTVLTDSLAKLQNIHVSVSDEDGKIVFLHKLKEGAADRSYGIHVAELAELPSTVIKRAQVLLYSFENNDEIENVHSKVKVKSNHDAQLSFFDDPPKTSRNPKEASAIESIKNLELLEMTPIDAMNALFKLQKSLK